MSHAGWVSPYDWDPDPESPAVLFCLESEYRTWKEQLKFPNPREKQYSLSFDLRQQLVTSTNHSHK